jgi:hypothetical protein
MRGRGQVDSVEILIDAHYFPFHYLTHFVPLETSATVFPVTMIKLVCMISVFRIEPINLGLGRRGMPSGRCALLAAR